MSTEPLFSQQILDSLYKATITVASAETLDSVLRQIVSAARELVGSDFAVIGIFDQGNNLVKFIASGFDAQVLETMAGMPVQSGVLGRLLQEKKPIRLTHFSQHAGFAGFPDGHPVMDSFLGVPILVESELLGNLYLANKQGEESFSIEDQQLVEVLAAHAAVAIRKARLLQAHERYGKQLEKRNSQLAALNQAAMAITSELTLDKVLQQIVESARELGGADYAALGVPGIDGLLETFVFSGFSEEQAAAISHSPRGLGLLGAIIREKRSIRIDSIRDDPRSAGFPPGHPPMGSFMGVPVVAGGHVLGNLYLTNKEGDKHFESDDQELVEMLAAHAAIVIQNSRLYEQVGRLAIVAERARLGMDLHDGVIQSIFAVGLTLESARLMLPEDRVEADKLLGSAIEGLNNTIRDIRNFILDLRPHRFRGDLGQGMSRLVREFQANTMVPVSLEMSFDSGTQIPVAVARAMFLTTQEALANIARHARASSVVIRAGRTRSALELSIADDGIGFDTRAQVQTVGHGLSNMRARAESLQGSFKLESQPGQGTTISLWLPTDVSLPTSRSQPGTGESG